MAIAFDAVAEGNTVGDGSNLTFSHTTSGTNRLLLVGFWVGLGSGLPTIGAVTYAGTAMTLLYSDTTTFADQIQYVYYLVNPAVGANNVVITHTNGGSCYTYGISGSYTGVKQTGTIDSSPASTLFSSATSTSGTVTTVADNSWVIGIQLDHAGAATASAGANTTKRSSTDGWKSLFDSNGVVHPAGSLTLNSTFASSTGKFYTFSIAPFVAATTNPAFPPILQAINRASTY